MQDNLFTIAPDMPFLDVVIGAVMQGRLPDNGGMAPDCLALSDYTILLPTKRAVRTLESAFLRAVGVDGALLLPRLRPIAEGEEEASLVSAIAGETEGFGNLALPPAIGQLERRLVLMQLVQRWRETLVSAGRAGGQPGPPATQVAQLADELARLMDMVETENVALDRLASLVPENYADHWQKTLDFLKIITQWWPQYLAASDTLSPADRRNRALLAEAERMRRQPPKGPVIVAGVTGSVPATAQLIKAVAELSNGAIVLPGLDLSLTAGDAEIIVANHPEHPQWGMLGLLGQLGARIDNVRDLGGNFAGASAKSPRRLPIATRTRIVREALRPAPTTNQWQTLPERLSRQAANAALDGVAYLAAPTAEDEAEAIALILRQTADQPGRTAALVTPDRALARRVVARLEAWGIYVDDSAGRPFLKTIPGAFMELAINAVAAGFEPGATMALLKHPLTRLGRPASDLRKSACALEITVFRTSYFGHGLDGLEAALDEAARDVHEGRRRQAALARLQQADWDDMYALVHDLRQAYRPLNEIFAVSSTAPLRTFVTAHLAVAERLARLPGQTEAGGKEPEEEQEYELWRGEAGEVAARLFASFIDPALPELKISASDYPDFYRAIVAQEVVRPQVARHPRIFIWGQFEARLQRPDVMVLGSLNEGTWPPATDTGPWLNRPMLAELGLPSPEEKIGYTAHDFAQLLGAEEVYMTRAEMVDGAPTVPSRWILRLQAVLSSLELENALTPARPWLAWARLRDVGRFHAAAACPAPRPPLRLRPRKLSVSGIESLIANPYTIFARHVLRLDPLPLLGADPDASLKGSVIHEVLGRYLKKFPNHLPADPAAELTAISEHLFGALRSHPRIAAFWVVRFRRFAEWFGSADAILRGSGGHSFGEIAGALVLASPGGPFTLTARADRIDAGADGLAITDYKTGASLDELVLRAKAGRAPQLLLEALIAGHGGFAGIPAAPVLQLRYVSASGGDPPGNIAEVKLDNVQAAISETERELGALIARFDDPATPYIATRRAHFRYDFDPYAHLARVAEWLGEEQEGDAV